MNFFDLFGTPQQQPRQFATPSPQSKFRKTPGMFFARYSHWFHSNQRLSELDAACGALREKCNALLAENSGLCKEIVILRTAAETNRTCVEQLRLEVHRLKVANQTLTENANLLQQESATWQAGRPEWAKHLSVDDLFSGATNCDDKARKFRALSKIYHPDIRNTAAGLKNMIQHLQECDPAWFRAACHEAYILIIRKKATDVNRPTQATAQ